MGSLLNRVLFGEGRGGRGEVAVTVYSRQGCGCCEKAIATLKGFQRRYRLVVDVVDVDGDPELKARYGMEVPVVVVEGKVRFRGSINPTMLERLLRAEGGEQATEG